MSKRLLAGMLCLVALSAVSWRLRAAESVAKGLFARKNLIAWCIVPFDSRKRGPEERAAMLEKLGFTKFAYDYRAEHIPTFDAEIEALKRHHVELTAWWFPTTLNDEAKMTIEIFAKHKVTPQLWVTGGGGPTKDEADQKARVATEAARIRPIAEAAAKVGCKVALYNHGGWFGEPENQIAIIQELKLDNVGIVYNLHHGHDHLDRFAELLQKMKPHLYALNLNGMVKGGDRTNQKILQLGQGDLDVKLLKIIRDSGYTGLFGILGHTQDDAEQRLQDNLDGLDWLIPQVSGAAAGPKPKPRTPVPQAAAAAVPAPTDKPLAAGKFGQALDGRAGGAFVAGRDEFRQFPITVECWTRLKDKSSYNILVAHELKSSGTHWELFSMAATGNFTVYLPGFAPDHCNSNAMICDDTWHHIAMVLEPARIRLFVDGKQVADQQHKRSDRATEPGGLALASLVDRAIGCSGLVDEVRISNGVREIADVPSKPFEVDDLTLALWHMDELVEQKRLLDASPKKNTASLGDANAAKAQPANGVSKTDKIEGHWGEDAVGFRWTEADSRDDRFGKVDSGSFFSGSITGAGGPVYKGIVVRIGEQREASVCYDTELLRPAAGWKGFVKIDPARFGIIVPPKIDGDVVFSTPRFPGVTCDEQFANFREANPYGPLPKEVAHYQGLFRHGKRVVLNYVVGAAETGNLGRKPPPATILESPWLETIDGASAITRTMFVAASPRLMRLMVADGKARVRLHAASASAKLIEQPGIGQVLLISAHDKPATIKLLIATADTNDAAFERLIAASPAPEDLTSLAKPGPKLWGQPLVTQGEVAKADRDTAPYVVDTITLPFDNRYAALFFCGGHDFLSDGRAAVCTLHGDVWLVGGIDQELERITWTRFATGLFQPLGLKVVGDQIYVTGRDQITRLKDLNGDGEADVYENFNNDAHVTLNGHEYVTCLETDRAGNFYFVKGNCNSQTPHDGSLLRVSADGSRLDVFATGFRNPNGMGMGPRDEITVAPQEGEWTPASGVFLVHEGGFYGGMMSHHRATAPVDFEHPLVWFPRLADNSSGGQVWSTGTRWGPLSNQLLHMSYGQCRLRLVLQDSAPADLNNGASIELPLRFTSGVHRGRMNPHDGQLYVTGLKGWTTSAVHDGCFQRVRYTGKSIDIPIKMQTYANGVALTFTSELDREAAQDPTNYEVEAWNYKWSAAYGSPEYKPSALNQIGRDEINIRSATLLQDNRTVFLEIPDLKPVDQLSVGYTLEAPDHRAIEQTAVLTVNSVPEQVFRDDTLYRQPADRLANLKLTPGCELVIDGDRHSQRRLASWSLEPYSPIAPDEPIRAYFLLKAPFTGEFGFTFEGSGSASITIGELIAESLSKESPVEVHLKKGLHKVKILHQPKPQEEVRFRLMWESKRFPRESVPSDLLFSVAPAQVDPSKALQERGRELYVSHQCARCHESTNGDTADVVEMPESLRGAPSLAGIGSRLSPEWMTNWIKAPRSLRSHVTMPTIISDAADLDDIVAYLISLRIDLDQGESKNTELESSAEEGRVLFEQLGCIACHSFRPPAEVDEWQRVSLHFIGKKFQPIALRQFLENPQRHHVGSQMPDFRLARNEAASLADFLMKESKGRFPGDSKASIGDAGKGRAAFERLRCGNCHVTESQKPLATATFPPAIRRRQNYGCLVATPAEEKGGATPRFEFTAAEREALETYISRLDRRPVPGSYCESGVDSLARLLSSLRCHACHARDGKQPSLPDIVAEEGSGKPTESLPQLSWVGEKLQGPWIEKLLKGEVAQKPRPWLKARMPAFPAYAGLIAHAMAAEHGVPFEEPIKLELVPDNVEAGRRLTLRDGGLDCRQCHGVGKEQPRGDASTQIALGINFAMTQQRLRPEFALRQMLDPPRYDIGSRMPRFAPDLRTTAAKQIADGDARKQFEMLKQYLWSLKDE